LIDLLEFSVTHRIVGLDLPSPRALRHQQQELAHLVEFAVHADAGAYMFKRAHTKMNTSLAALLISIARSCDTLSLPRVAHRMTSWP
jgi:hypothetical protein